MTTDDQFEYLLLAPHGDTSYIRLPLILDELLEMTHDNSGSLYWGNFEARQSSASSFILSRDLISPVLEALSGHPLNSSTPAHALIHQTIKQIARHEDKMIADVAVANGGNGNDTTEQNESTIQQEDDSR